MNTKALIQELLEKDYPFTLAHKETHALRLYEEGVPLDDYYIVCKMTGEIITELPCRNNPSLQPFTPS